MTGELPEAIEAWRGREDLTLEDLVEASSRLLADVAPSQTRYKVTERPDVRTIRYYTSRGLLPKPLGYGGGRARYGFAHLVRLLAIKRMQAEHFTLDQVARALGAGSDDEGALRLAPASTALRPPAAASLEVAAAAGAPVRTVASPRTLRLEMVPGAELAVPREVLSSGERRARLAQNLESLAAWLRASCPDDKPEGEGP